MIEIFGIIKLKFLKTKWTVKDKREKMKDFKNKGFEKIFTSNEENNPIYKINLKLGFKTIATEVGCKLVL